MFVKKFPGLEIKTILNKAFEYNSLGNNNFQKCSTEEKQGRFAYVSRWGISETNKIFC